MSDLIRKDDVIERLQFVIDYGMRAEDGDHPLSAEKVLAVVKTLPTAEPKEYVKDGTLTIQMPTIKEAKAIDKIVVYADTYRQEYFMPLPKPYKMERSE